MSLGGRWRGCETIKKMGVVICCQSLLEYTQVNKPHTLRSFFSPWFCYYIGVTPYTRQCPELGKDSLRRTSMQAFFRQYCPLQGQCENYSANNTTERMSRLPWQISVSLKLERTCQVSLSSHSEGQRHDLMTSLGLEFLCRPKSLEDDKCSFYSLSTS